jgi:hypothetical protein
MVEKKQARSDAQDAEHGENNGIPRYLRGVFIAGAWGVVSLLLTAIFWPNLTERMKFFTSTLWILVTTFAVIAQVVIYRKQWQIMERQVEIARIAERAYIGIKSTATENFTLGYVPVARITVLNGGRTPAFKLKAPASFVIGTEFPSERPELGNVIGTTFLPAGLSTTYNYPFPIKLDPNWMRVFQAGKRKAFLNIEFHFEDCWGERQVTPLRLECKVIVDVRRGTCEARWGEYKDGQNVEPIIEITP